MILYGALWVFLAVLGGLPPCEWEDSTGCFWDAQERGNGLGRSFVALDRTS
jgi:hypothetical protein